MDPASWIDRHEVAPALETDCLDLDALAPAQLHRLAVALVDDARSQPIRAPVLVARGAEPGPVVGLTAALHGNELNGIPTIHRLLRRVDPLSLAGSVVAVAIANLAGYDSARREYRDGRDLNRIMPGKPDGNESQVYAHRLLSRIVRRFEYLIDLHTASFGRANSLYVRANMTNEVTARMARLVGAEIIVHNQGADGTLRSAAVAAGIPAITVEIGDPQVFERGKIRASRIGLRDLLEHLGMVAPDSETAPAQPIECGRSYWLYTDTGGLLDVRVEPAERVAAGAVVATLSDPWGQKLRTYRAPEAAIVVGRSTNPVAHTGSRVVHLGIEGPPVPAPSA